MSASNACSRRATAVIVADGRLLLLRRDGADGQARWLLPECPVADGESAEDAVVRETRRLVGMTVEVRKSLCEAPTSPAGQTTVYLACHPVKGAPFEVDDATLGSHEWCGQSELLLYLAAPLADEVQRYIDTSVG